MALKAKSQSTNPISNLLNKIRSYSPNNSNSGINYIFGRSRDWESKVLNDTLSILKGNGL